VLLDFGEGQLDGIEIGRVGRQEQQSRADGFHHRLPAASALWALKLSSTTWLGRKVGASTRSA
jgi:hypothetical protein